MIVTDSKLVIGKSGIGKFIIEENESGIISESGILKFGIGNHTINMCTHTHTGVTDHTIDMYTHRCG